MAVFAKEKGRYPTEHGYGQGLPIVAPAPDELRLLHWSEVGLTPAQREPSGAARARLGADTQGTAVMISGKRAFLRLPLHTK